MLNLDVTLKATQSVAALPQKEDANWLLNFITFKTDKAPLSVEDEDKVYTELKKKDLSPESYKAVMTVLGSLIPVESFVFNAISIDHDEDLVLKLLTDDLIKLQGQNFLFAACSKGMAKVVQRLLESGHVDVNKRDSFQQSPLLRACDGDEGNEKKLAVIDLLLKAGAQAEDSATGSTPLMELLLNKADNQTELQHQMSAVKSLVQAGANVNMRNAKGETPLHTIHSPELVALLQSFGAEINAVDEQGNTPLMTFLSRGSNDPSEVEQRLRFAETLIQKGADVKTKNKNGDTPLHFASRIEFVKLLQTAGADINALNDKGESVLERSKTNESIRYLVQVGADIQVRRDDETLIHRKLLYAPKEEVAAYLNLSEQEAETIQNDYKNRFFLGHVNSIRTSKTDPITYEGSNDRTKICTEMAKMLADLPEPLAAHIDQAEKKQLIEAFKLAGNKDIDNEKVVSLIQEGKLVVLPVGFRDHAIHLVFCNGYMTVLNRGGGVPTSSMWPDPIRKLLGIRKTDETIKAYKIDSQAFTEEMLEELIEGNAGESENALKYLYTTLPSLLSPRADKKPVQDTVCKQLEKLRAKTQKLGNCTYTQAKLSMRVAKAMINIQEVDGKPILDKTDVHDAYAFSKDFSSHIRLTAMDRYLVNHLIGPDDTTDKGLLSQTYAKLKKRLEKFPDLRFYPNFKKWAEKLEALRLKEWSMQVDKLAPFYI
jgi:ankyrin repeat protein